MSNKTVVQVLIYSHGRCIGVFRATYAPNLTENAHVVRFDRSDTGQRVTVTKHDAVIAIDTVNVDDPIPGERLGWRGF